MKNIDDTIRAALRAEDRELFEEFGGEQSLFDMVVESFRGRNRWIKLGMFANILVFAVFAVLTAIQFFQADTMRGMIGWATGFVCCILGTMMMKLWWWAQLDKSALTREIKRLELQIARLAARMKEE
ncbi:MAG: DUF6768 family protein [Planctomycetota bacterium]|jgi:uncharacterized membrane protein YciS (DUF1049 family)